MGKAIYYMLNGKIIKKNKWKVKWYEKSFNSWIDQKGIV